MPNFCFTQLRLFIGPKMLVWLCFSESYAHGDRRKHKVVSEKNAGWCKKLRFLRAITQLCEFLSILFVGSFFPVFSVIDIRPIIIYDSSLLHVRSIDHRKHCKQISKVPSARTEMARLVLHKNQSNKDLCPKTGYVHCDQ